MPPRRRRAGDRARRRPPSGRLAPAFQRTVGGGRPACPKRLAWMSSHSAAKSAKASSSKIAAGRLRCRRAASGWRCREPAAGRSPLEQMPQSASSLALSQSWRAEAAERRRPSAVRCALGAVELIGRRHDHDRHAAGERFERHCEFAVAERAGADAANVGETEYVAQQLSTKRDRGRGRRASRSPRARQGAPGRCGNSGRSRRAASGPWGRRSPPRFAPASCWAMRASIAGAISAPSTVMASKASADGRRVRAPCFSTRRNAERRDR